MPPLRRQERQQTIAFLLTKNRVVQWRVGQTRLGGTEHSNDSRFLGDSADLDLALPLDQRGEILCCVMAAVAVGYRATQ